MTGIVRIAFVYAVLCVYLASGRVITKRVAESTSDENTGDGLNLIVDSPDDQWEYQFEEDNGRSKRQAESPPAEAVDDPSAAQPPSEAKPEDPAPAEPPKEPEASPSVDPPKEPAPTESVSDTPKEPAVAVPAESAAANSNEPPKESPPAEPVQPVVAANEVSKEPAAVSVVAETTAPVEPVPVTEPAKEPAAVTEPPKEVAEIAPTETPKEQSAGIPSEPVAPTEVPKDSVKSPDVPSEPASVSVAEVPSESTVVVEPTKDPTPVTEIQSTSIHSDIPDTLSVSSDPTSDSQDAHVPQVTESDVPPSSPSTAESKSVDGVTAVYEELTTNTEPSSSEEESSSPEEETSTATTSAEGTNPVPSEISVAEVVTTVVTSQKSTEADSASISIHQNPYVQFVYVISAIILVISS